MLRHSVIFRTVGLILFLGICVATTKGSDTFLKFLGDPIPTSKPVLSEASKPWVDASGKYAVVATLIDLDGDVVRLKSVENEDKSIKLDRLSKADAAHARLVASERVNIKATVSIGSVVKISDGDTIEIRTIDEKTQKIRLEGIDAPETGQPFGSNAKKLLGDLVFSKTVRAEIVDVDKYGRHLAHIYVDDRWVNRAMVRAGLAWHYTKYSSDEDLAQAESVARLEGIGLWSDKEPIAPWDWRAGSTSVVSAGTSAPAPMAPVATKAAKPAAASSITTPAETQYEVGASERIVYTTKTGSKYHRAGCKHLAKSMIAIPLSRATKSLSPCSHCNP